MKRKGLYYVEWQTGQDSHWFRPRTGTFVTREEAVAYVTQITDHGRVVKTADTHDADTVVWTGRRARSASTPREGI